MYTKERWLEEILLPQYQQLPASAKELSDCYFGFYLWLQDEEGDVADAAVAYRLSLLYRWVDKAGKIPTPITYERQPMFRWEKATSHILDIKEAAVLPRWLFNNLPDADGGFRRKDKNIFLCATYLNPWKALEEAALACPEFVELIGNELYAEA